MMKEMIGHSSSRKPQLPQYLNSIALFKVLSDGLRIWNDGSTWSILPDQPCT